MEHKPQRTKQSGKEAWESSRETVLRLLTWVSLELISSASGEQWPGPTAPVSGKGHAVVTTTAVWGVTLNGSTSCLAG